MRRGRRGLQVREFPHDDSVGPVAECGFQQLSKSYLTLVHVELDLGRDDVLLSNIKFSNILKDQNTVLIGDKTGQDIEQSGFARTCCAGDEQIVAATDGVFARTSASVSVSIFLWIRSSIVKSREVNFLMVSIGLGLTTGGRR
jgi:hypothetical protein